MVKGNLVLKSSLRLDSLLARLDELYILLLPKINAFFNELFAHETNNIKRFHEAFERIQI